VVTPAEFETGYYHQPYTWRWPGLNNPGPLRNPGRFKGVPEPRGARTVYPLLVLALGLTGCGPQAPTSHPSGNATAAATSAPPPCPEPPPGGSLPSPLPALGDALKLPADPCFARYEGVADVRGLTTFNLTIGRIPPGRRTSRQRYSRALRASRSICTSSIRRRPCTTSRFPVSASTSTSRRGGPQTLSRPSRRAVRSSTSARTTAPRSKPENPSPCLDDEGGMSRINLRLPEHLKARIERDADGERISVNAWLVRAAVAALERTDSRRQEQRAPHGAQRYTGWAR
jgi:hypothetical protein